eukprot:g1100.t1
MEGTACTVMQRRGAAHGDEDAEDAERRREIDAWDALAWVLGAMRAADAPSAEERRRVRQLEAAVAGEAGAPAGAHGEKQRGGEGVQGAGAGAGLQPEQPDDAEGDARTYREHARCVLRCAEFVRLCFGDFGQHSAPVTPVAPAGSRRRGRRGGERAGGSWAVRQLAPQLVGDASAVAAGAAFEFISPATASTAAGPAAHASLTAAAQWGHKDERAFCERLLGLFDEWLRATGDGGDTGVTMDPLHTTIITGSKDEDSGNRGCV